jgi:hypothetical protein
MLFHRPPPLYFLAISAVALTAPALAQSFELLGERKDVQVIRDVSQTYTIPMGGTADMDNTTTRKHETWDIGFQNNVSLLIENTGSSTVVNPRIITNGKREWQTADSMLAEFTAGAKDPQEKIYMIWEGLRQNRHHDDPLFEKGDYHDPVRFLNCYGGGFCDDSGAIGSGLFHLAGFNAEAGGQDPFVRGLHGHVMCEVWHDGDFQWMDIDQSTFFLDRENRKPVSGDTATRDHDYARRELAFGPIFPGWEAPARNATLFGADDERGPFWKTGHAMNYSLRPGEQIEFFWERRGKTPWQEKGRKHRYYGNSELLYTLPADPARLSGTDVVLDGFKVARDAFYMAAEVSTMTIPVASPYTICGGNLAVQASPNFPPNSAFRVELSLDGQNYEEIYRRTAMPRWAVQVPLDEALKIHGGDPKRTYWLRISCINARGASLRAVRLRTDLYTYPIALPRLSVGDNSVAYTDESPAGRTVRVTYRWKESGNVQAPAAPAAPESPAVAAEVHATQVPFAWPAVEGCDAYWLRVSRDPEFKYPYRPNYDVVLTENKYEVPFAGMFSPGETYYWRVRPRLANGMWGNWSETWSFTWTGPTVPKDLALDQKGEDKVTLTWAPNPSGIKPVRYKIYGSNEKGFSIGGDAIQAMHQGPPMVMVETKRPKLVVGGRKAEGPLANLAYYRVVAVDKEGVESCPSDYVELPRPLVYSTPVTKATVGEAFQYPIQAVTSMGDLQHRYDAPGNAYWEKESPRFEKVSGPDWLSVDERTGVVQGTPTEKAGKTEVVIRITTAFDDEVRPEATQAAAFIKAKEGMVKSAEHRFVVAVK